ncbi:MULTISPECIES: DUF4153 domain-containing protein [unclassified Marinovum]
MPQPDTDTALDRLILAMVGALAGLAAWYFSELAENVLLRPRLFLFAVTTVMGGFALLLALVGPLSWPRALAGAGALALFVAGLLLWSSFRFETPGPIFDSGLPIAAMTFLFGIGTPFVSAGLQRRGGALHYPLLFDTAWAVLVRYLAAWLFTGVAWGLVYLSDALLGLVGVTFIRRLLEVDPVPFALTGVFLGLAMAIVHELRAYVSPFLVLRLFRVILPVLTVVVAVFLLALPVRGLDGLFGDLSVAATLMAVAIAAITLVTSALDRSTADEAEARVMRGAARAICVMLPLLTAAAVWTVWLRVAAHGWTPERLAAGLSAAVLLGYAALYAGVAVRRDWAQRIRQVNLGMALVVMALAALWLTPVLNAESISTRSQIARFEAQEVDVDGLALWEMKADWGRAGASGLDRLSGIAAAGAHPEAEALKEALAVLGKVSNRYDYDRDRQETAVSDRALADILARLAVFPEGQKTSVEELATLPPYLLESLTKSCARGGEDGPGCVLVLADLNPHKPGDEGILLQRTDRFTGFSIFVVSRLNGRLNSGRNRLSDVTGVPLSGQWETLVEAIRTGNIAIVPSGQQMITFGEIGIIP